MKFPLFPVLLFLTLTPLSWAGGAAPSSASAATEAPAGQAAEPEKSSAEEPEESPESTAVGKILKSLHYKSGTQTLADGAVSLELPEGWQFLNAADTRKVLVDLWSNPPGTGSTALGMLVPPGESLAAEESWAVIVRFDDSGYVSDEDAEKTDYDELLEEMQKDTEENNKSRKKAGYFTMTLKGWALPPHYDHDAKVLHWAKEFEVEGEEEHTLNYDVRVLGRRGVVSLNCLAGITQLDKVKTHTPELIAMTKFNSGHTYADYDPATDRKAAYGIAGLIAGGAVAAKTGFLKGIWLAILAGKKFVIVALLGIGAFVKKLFARRGE